MGALHIANRNKCSSSSRAPLLLKNKRKKVHPSHVKYINHLKNYITNMNYLTFNT